jgi:hypothetical protein
VNNNKPCACRAGEVRLLALPLCSAAKISPGPLCRPYPGRTERRAVKPLLTYAKQPHCSWCDTELARAQCFKEEKTRQRSRMCHQIKLNGVIPSQKKDGGFFSIRCSMPMPHTHTHASIQIKLLGLFTSKIQQTSGGSCRSPELSRFQ